MGYVPLAAEILQTLKPVAGELPGGYRLDRLASALPEWIAATEKARRTADPFRPRRVLFVASLRWWLEYGAAVCLLFSGLGHDVDLAYVPYRTWWETVDRFDARRHRVYLHQALSPLRKLIGLRDISTSSAWSLSSALNKAVEEQSRTDVQYTLQREGLNLSEEGEDLALYRLRRERNTIAANAAIDLLSGGRYDVVIIPNGSILEFGIFYRVAKYLNAPLVTIEFGEQRERMWLTQNGEVMRLDTSLLWEARHKQPLTQAELQELQTLYEARRGGKAWENFSRQWQSGGSRGAAQVREELGLDAGRPMVLLCTNVVGDSLALGRQVFTSGMADWLVKTVRYFAQRQDVQIVVRVHPGELLGAGHPSVEIVRASLPDMPPHVIVIHPDSKINTYDLIGLTHLGLVYTTTVGMEMAMSGVPVVVSGMTHYRNKGFTYDPETMTQYITMVDQLINRPLGDRLPQEQIDRSWNYAYRFFFEYPFPFPWHLISFWDDIEERSIESVLSGSVDHYASTLDALLGKPIYRSDPGHRGGRAS
jgi:hypothetical protein